MNSKERGFFMSKIYYLIGVLVMSLLATNCQQQIDIEAAKAELLQVAQQFNKENSEIGYIEGYNKYMAEDVLILQPGSQPVMGRENYYTQMKVEGLLGQLEGDVQGVARFQQRAIWAGLMGDGFSRFRIHWVILS
jgi:hypothetical protein